MNDRRIIGLATLVLALAGTAGCAGQGDTAAFEGPEADGGGMLQVALDGDYQVLSSPFRIRLYRGVPDSLAAKPYFESGCTPARRGFTVNKVKSGADYVLVFEAFSTATCDAGSRIALGVRGGIEISPEGTGEAIYYIQVNASGDFTRFPIPGAALSSPNPPVPCAEDADCQQLIDCPDIAACRFPRTVECEATENCPTGTKVMQYQVHPAATCVNQYCRLESLFPLNARLPRAFHVAASTAAGDVSLLGGFTEARARTLVVAAGSDIQEAPDAERFDGDGALFSTLELDRDLGGRLALAATGTLGDDAIVLAGGTASIGMDIVGDLAVPWPGPNACGTEECPLALSSLAWVVDLGRGTAVPSDLPAATAAGQVAGVPGPTGLPRVFVRAGLVQSADEAEVRLGREAWICELNEESQMACQPIGEMAARSGRFLAAGVCLTEASGGLCQEYLILGGNTQGGAFAELYSAQSDTLTSLTPLSGVPDTLFGAVAVNVDGRIVTVGGGSQPRKADVAPMRFTVDAANGTIRGETLPLTQEQVAPLQRLFHSATALLGGRDILVAGGLDATLVPTRSATVLRFDGDTVTVAGQWDGLNAARAGHQATRIRGGLLAGGILITGGLESLRGVPTFAEGAEIFLP